MTTPSGRPGFNAIERFGITGDDGTIPDLHNRTQEVITGILKERYVGNPGSGKSIFTSTTGPLAEVFKGLPVIPGTTSLPVRILAAVAGRLLGVDPASLVSGSTNEERVTSVIMALEKMPFFGEIIELLTGIEDGDPNDLATWARNLLNRDSPIDALKLYGQIRSALLGPLPIGLFTDQKLTLLRDSGFDDPITIVEGSGYTHDATDGVPGSDPLGCARVECDGQWHVQSSPLIKVAPGWTLTTPAQVKYESVVAAANSNAVRIELVPYNGTTPGTAVWMASDESPAGTVDWNDLNAWGQYIVPATGVTDVAVLTVVTPDATGGVVKFDNVDVLAIQKIPQAFTKDLPEDLASLLNFIQTWVHSALTALGITPSGVLLDDILDLSDELEFIQSRAEQGIADAAQALSDFTDFLSGGWQPLLDGVKGATGGGISDIINRLVNITSGGLFDAAKLSNVTGTAPQSLITGLTDLAAQSNQIGDILAGLVVTPINSTVAAIKDWFTGNINKTQNLTVGGLFDATKLTGLVDPESVGGVGGAADIGAAVQGAIDKIVQAAGDLTGGGFGLDDLLGGLAGLRNTATGANEYVIDIQNQLVENAIGGISAIVKIADYADAATPPSVFTKVLDTGSGSIVTSGGKLVWSGSPGKEMYLYNVEALQSDLFEVSFVMPNAPTHGPFGVDGDNFLYPIGRSNSAGTAMCFAEVGWKSVRIGCLASGVTTWFGSVDWHGGSYEVPSGALVKFKGGTIENGRYFQVFVNNRMVLDAYDNLSVSRLGASFRNCGIGMQDDSYYSTGTVSVWSMVDGNLGIATGTVTGYNNGVLASLKLWTGTAAQYAAIGTKDSATVYVVTA